MSSLLGFVSKKSQRNYHSWESMDFYRGHACAQIMKTIFHKISCVTVCCRHRPLNYIHIDMRKSSKSNVLYSHQSQSCCGHHNQSVNPSGVKSQQAWVLLYHHQNAWMHVVVLTTTTDPICPDHINEACDAVFIFSVRISCFHVTMRTRKHGPYTILSNDTPSPLLSQPNNVFFQDFLYGLVFIC